MFDFLPLLLAFAAPQAVDHSPLHPTEAVLFVQASDCSAIKAAYQGSHWVDAILDEELQEGLAHMLKVDVSELGSVVESMLVEGQAEFELGTWLGHLNQLRAISGSLCIVNGDPIGATKHDLFGTPNQDKLYKIRAIAEFGTAQAADAALASLLKTLGTQVVPFLKVEGTRLVLSFGRMSPNEDPGPPMAKRWGPLGAELGEPLGSTLFEAYSSLGDGPIQWAENFIGYAGVDGPIGQALTSMVGAPFVILTRGGAWRVTAKDGEFYTSGRYHHRSDSDVDEVFGRKALTAKDLSFIHPDAKVAGALSIDHDALLPWARSVVALTEQTHDPDAFEQIYGFQPIRDLIEPLGDSVHWSLNGNLGFGVPPSQLSVRITDEEALKRGIRGFAGWIEAVAEGQIETKTQTYKGVQIVTFRYSGDDLKTSHAPVDLSVLIRPTVAVLDDRMILTLNRTLAKREVKRVKKGEPKQGAWHAVLAQNSNHTNAGSIVISDWMEVMRRLAGLAQSAAAMAGPMSLPPEIERMPDPQLFTRHFNPSFEIQTRSDRCVHYESRSCVGPESLIGITLSVGLAATQVVPPTMASFNEAKRGKCAGDLATLYTTLSVFAINNGGSYPDALERLVEPDFNGKRYLRQTIVPKDPWGNSYLYNPDADEAGPRIWSCGPDGIDNQGQGDDITAKSILEGN